MNVRIASVFAMLAVVAPSAGCLGESDSEPETDVEEGVLDDAEGRDEQRYVKPIKTDDCLYKRSEELCLMGAGVWWDLDVNSDQAACADRICVTETH